MAPSVDTNPVVTLHAPETAPAGTLLYIIMRIQNPSEQKLELYLSGRETVCDLTVTNAAGDVVWRRLEGEVTQGILRLELLEPGQTLEFRETWDQRDNAGLPVPPGTYSVRGAVLTDGSSTLEAGPEVFRIEREK